jgi:hypothetical protein
MISLSLFRFLWNKSNWPRLPFFITSKHDDISRYIEKANELNIPSMIRKEVKYVCLLTNIAGYNERKKKLPIYTSMSIVRMD